MENTELATQPSLRASLGSVAVGNHGVQLATMDDIFRFSKAIHMSQLCPKGFSETDVFVILCQGLELGMAPMSALASFYVVNGRAALFGDMPLALVRQSGQLEDYNQEYQGKPFDDDYKCVVTTLRKGSKTPITSEYSVADAKVAQTWGKTGPWQSAPKRMLMFRARGFALRDNFGDVLKGCSIAELDDNEPGFANAKPARVVEPNFETKTEKPFQKSEKFGEKFLQMKEEVRNALQPNDAELKERANADLDAAVENGKKTYSPNEPMRPSRSEGGPSKASAPVEAPAPPTKPVAPPKPPRPPKQAPPATDEGTRLYKIHVKLKEEGIDQTKFLLVLFDFGLLDPGIEREDISAGNVGLDKLDHKALDVAAKNWKQVLEEVAKL